MDLIKEISGERLVIMVTHNPELAEQYSTRIIRLLDGRVLEDSNPYTAEEEAEECAIKAAALAEEEALAEETPAPKKAKKKRREKAKMSVFTAFMLSAKNLLSKKGRTTMVGIAGSIGIVGIAMVLAFSAGIKGYIASMQDDILSGNPITIAETSYDLTSITGMMESLGESKRTDKDGVSIYTYSIIETLVSLKSGLDSIVTENEINAEYIKYIKNMDPALYQAMILGYGFDLSANIYTDYKFDAASDPENISLHRLLNVAKSVLKETDIAGSADRIVSFAPSFQQMPNNEKYILSQYNLVGEGSRLASAADEIMLVLNADDELSDILLTSLGYFTQEEVIEIVNRAQLTKEEKNEYSNPLYKDKFSYTELLSKEFVWYPNNTVFTENADGDYEYLSESSSFVSDENNGGMQLKIVGILTPKDTVSYGSLASGIYYTEALTSYVLEQHATSNVQEWIASDESLYFLATNSYSIPYDYTFSYLKVDENNPLKTAKASIGPTLSTMEALALSSASRQISRLDKTDIDGIKEALKSFDISANAEKFARKLGGVSVANAVTIYPLNFNEKYKVTDYLDAWNKELPEGEVFTYTDLDGNLVTVADEYRTNVTYTDSIEIIINLINTMIEIITVGLIAFTSISLVVSTVMIGIITYVSVVERIKEIGVIRSLGGRKRDVSNLFIAETFIIGLLAGLIGIVSTYVISSVVSAILAPFIGYSNIASLPIDNAIILIVLSVLLTLVSGLAPASSAAKKDPVVALRTE